MKERHPIQQVGCLSAIERLGMLLIVTFRTEGTKYADGHIADSNCTQVFCGVHIASAVLECGLNDIRNPYVGKSPATCAECISEYNNGRRSGFRENNHGA